MKISLVMPIHNEERLLRFVLPTYYDSLVDEYLFVLDRCTDGSRKVILSWAQRFGVEDRVRLLNYDTGSWTYRTCEVRNYAFSQAKGDLLFYGDADILYDSRAYHLPGLCNYGVTSFAVLISKKFWDHYYTFLFTRGFTYESSLSNSCIMVTPREVFRRIGFTDTLSGDCADYRRRVVESGYKVRHLREIKVTHLAYRADRAFNKKKRKYVQLRNGLRYKSLGTLGRMLLYAIIRLQPCVVVGYRIRDERAWMKKYDPYA